MPDIVKPCYFETQRPRWSHPITLKCGDFMIVSDSHIFYYLADLFVHWLKTL